jgi:hypothetical protein
VVSSQKSKIKTTSMLTVKHMVVSWFNPRVGRFAETEADVLLFTASRGGARRGRRVVKSWRLNSPSCWVRDKARGARIETRGRGEWECILPSVNICVLLRRRVLQLCLIATSTVGDATTDAPGPQVGGVVSLSTCETMRVVGTLQAVYTRTHQWIVFINPTM